MLRRCDTVLAAVQRGALGRQDRYRDQAERAAHQERRPPSEGAAESEAHDRRQRVAEAASDAVRAVGMTEPPRVDVGIEHGEVGRMEHPIADAHQDDQRKQPADTGHEPGDERPAGQQAKTGEQHRTGPEAIDGEAGAELADAAGDIHDAQQCAQRRIADAEFGTQQRKQRRQHELEEMRQRVRGADDADHFGVGAERAGGGTIQGGRNGS